MYIIRGKHLTVLCDTDKATYRIVVENKDEWIMPGRPYVLLTDHRILYLDECQNRAEEYETGTVHGVAVDYDLGAGLTLYTRVYLENTRDDLYFECRMEGDEKGQVACVSYPSAVDFNAEVGHGYTVLPRMQGTYIPAGSPIQIVNGIVFERDAYMPLFGQVRDESGYMAVIDTPYDALYALLGENIEFRFIPSLGRMAYPRRMLYRFTESCDYSDFAASFRSYLEERGQIYTLREKVAKNPSVERLFGAPVIHTDIATHISPESDFYRPDDPQFNDHYTSFDARGEQLRALKEKGLRRAYIHLDGWGRHGYDNLHPDPFPPHKAAGGAEAMARLSATARELGYIFGIHDQYRDYYYDAPTFDLKNAVQHIDGSHPLHSLWNGGRHSFLCAKLAPSYVRRNYDEFERLGIDLQAAYLDVFSVVNLDECFNSEHPMTREECAEYRNECLNYLTSRGIIPSSEETVSCLLPSMVLCHHAPFYTTAFETDESEAVGIPIPLFNLVYHDCVVTPWIGLPGKRGGWGIPKTDSPYLYGILYGGPVYCPIDATEDDLLHIRIACESAKRLTHARMLRHEFLDDDYRRQRTTWSDGTVIEANLDSGEFHIANG